MANYATLKAAIQQVVKTNGNNEITGALLQQSLLAMINSLGAGFHFMGIATPTTNPGTPDQNVFYLASTAGTYANFGSLVLADGEIAILKYNGAWSKDLTGAASLEIVNQFRRNINDLTYLLSNVSEDRTIVPTYSDGFINSTGGVTASQYARYCDFIPITDGARYYYNAKTASSWYIGYYASNNESSFIGSQQLPQSPSTATRIDLLIPNGAQYFRLTTIKDNNPPVVQEIGPSTLLDNRVITYINNLQSQIDNIDIATIRDLLSNVDVSNVLEPNYTRGGFINATGGVTASQYAKYSDFVKITDGAEYDFYSATSTGWYIGYYSSNNENSFISAQQEPGGTQKVELVIPSGAQYFRISVNDSTSYGKINEFIPGGLLSKKVIEYIDELQQQIDAGNGDNYAGIDKLGYINSPGLFDADLLYVPMYGQSYTVANDGQYKITDTFDPNVYMHGLTRPIGAGSQTLRPLSVPADEEYIISDFGNIFSQLLKKYTYKEQDILVGSYGEGSRSVMELSKNNPYGEGYHTYETVFEPGVANACAAAANANKSISCPFILYLQGESDTVEGARPSAATPDSYCKGDKNLYKQYLLQLKNDMQQTIKTATGQTISPVMFIYTCGNDNFRSKESGIQQACLELAQENADIFVVGPYYEMPSMGAHPSPDGRRWLAELFAKQVFETLVNGEDTTMKIASTKINGKNLVLSVKTPFAPLQVDTWTYPERANYGFMLFSKVGGVLTNIPISSVVVSGEKIVLCTNSDLSQISGLFVTYGNSDVNGGGNICDSGKWRSYYKYASNNNGTGNIVYIPKDKDGNTLVGKHYPMQSWMPQFGMDV